MAHKESVQNGEVKKWLEASMFWNISSSVGYGCPNKEADVLLVQFLLNTAARICEQTEHLLVPDGQFGGKTWARIKHFQADDSLSTVDGMVSAIDGTKLFGPKNKGIYSIIVLNRYYVAWLRHYYHDIRIDPKCPRKLVSILSGPMPALV